MYQRHKSGRFGKLCSVLVWTLLGAAGCSSHPLTASKDTPGDPLLGPAAPPSLQPTAPAQTGSLPPIPQNGGLTTNAALASQTPTGQTLAITNADGWARKVDNHAAPAGQVPVLPTAAPKVEAIPKDRTAATTVTPIQPTAWTTGSQPAAPTNEQLEQQLKDHGVIGHNQESVPGGVRLTCVVRSATNPSAVQNYYTTAADFSTAAQAILREIEAQRAHP